MTDSARDMKPLTVSPKVVRGKPVAMWRRFRDSPGMIIWAFASPIALIVAAVKLTFFYSRLSTGATFLYVLLALVAVGGLMILGLVRDARPVECECPACGARVWFEFTRRPIDPELPIARCDKCLVYVTQRDGQIGETSLEVTNDMQRFTVYTDQYEANVRRKDNGNIAFDMPTFCAACGADAPNERAVSITFSNTSVNNELLRQVNYVRTGDRGHGIGTSSAVTGISGADFTYQKVAVCAQHLAPTSRPVPLEIGESGFLYFASYRFYKAFVMANNIAPPGAEGLPAARVRS